MGAYRKNSEAEVQDMFVIKDPDQIIPDLIKTVEEYQPDIILMPMQEDVYQIGIEMLESIDHFGIPHVVGGIFPSSAPEVVLGTPVVQRIALHEGERTVRDIIAALRAGESLDKIKGTWSKKEDGSFRKNPPQPLCDITEVTPDFTCFQDHRWERPMGGRIWKRAISMETYRGCPYSCTYCNSPFMRDFPKHHGLGNFMRRKPADIIERDLLYYIENHSPDFIMFQDDSFLARPKKEIFEFCEMWSKYKIPFWFNTRIENCNPEYLEALKEAGVYRISFGLESGNEEYRTKVLKRPVTNEKYYEYFKYINDSDIPYSLNVILGMPLETREMVMDTVELVRAARGYDGLTVSKLQPYYGTGLRDVAVEHGFLDPSHINNSYTHGIIGTWELDMPKPYLQKHEVEASLKTFSMYAHFDKDMWPLIKKSETDEKLYKELAERYQKEFFYSTQQGGKTRIQTVYGGCAMHDATSTYTFEVCDK